MADEGAQDRQLPASERKIRKAREEGQVARSRDLGHFAALAVGGAALVGFAHPLAARLQRLLEQGLRFDYFMWFTPFVALALGRRPAWRALLPLHLTQCVVVFAMADLVVGPTALLGAFRGASPTYADGWPNLQEALLGAPPELAGQVLGILLSGFLVLSALLAWPALSELRAEQTDDSHSRRGDDERHPHPREPRTFQQSRAGLPQQA
jgi:hypothetical protein